MRAVEKLVHSRARVCSNYALMPLEGFPASRLPNWPNAKVTVLASPALGAAFVQYLIEVPPGSAGSFAADAQVETFLFVLRGTGRIAGRPLWSGSFALLPPGTELKVSAGDKLELLIVRKRYEAVKGIEMFKPLFGNESETARNPWAENPHARLQALIPDEIAYDMAMNIFTFDPGHGLPIVETHVMEHGLYFLEGKGMYFLGNQWMEVEANDFIWMGPYCPQSFYATGPLPSRYLYYKNVNREIEV